ncbi:hypothetical protein B1A99_17185 [Cohnella sp. CIP 111063]|uniref:copper resistance CopC family protein n=1 Tax=unclassified Cohnella TaxID=2636738 RepID=UPI000B8BC69F|nr:MULTISPECIES: copper resistance CopC family protein [unclassified Cohnella]OXS57223.1 hypothetical protein B1A99_17185 [Cohnella sp. CIP 111063]PRX70659.1 hypothetical protein B0G52_11125 [Cohnella sp. SGD-V74]
MRRFNWILLVMLVAMLLAPASVWAHTGLKSSTPENKQTVDTEVQEIVMTFNTGIEKASSFTVKDAQGTEYPLADKSVASSKLTGKLEQALPNGEYTVEWRIIGEDGHPIKGTFGFTVALPPEETPSPSPAESAAESAEPDTVQTEEETPSRLPEASSSPSLPASPEADDDAGASASLETRSTASNLLLITAGVLVVAFVVLALRKKK